MAPVAEQAKILYAEGQENNLDNKAMQARWDRWEKCSLCEQKYHGVVRCALGWACWKTYLGRPEAEHARQFAMTELGNGLSEADNHEDALSVQEAELSVLRRLGADEEDLLVAQQNLAGSYRSLGRLDDCLRTQQDVYSGTLELYGEQDKDTLVAANNYAVSLNGLQRFGEARSLLRRTMLVARRTLGEEDTLTLRMRKSYAMALYLDSGASLDDLREAVATMEETAPTARRILGGAHLITGGIEAALQNARAALRASEEAASGDMSAICEAFEAMTQRDA